MILTKLYDRLDSAYGMLISREQFLEGKLSMRDLDALLAYKSDPHLDELLHALERLDAGSYGMCMSCKSSISEDVLDSDPTQRLCTACEQKFVHMTSSSFLHSHVTT
jgi:RNA polymerase-binding transcription factor DksA